MSQPSSFTINIPDCILTLTRDKLLAARFPDEFDGVGWEGIAKSASNHSK